jgi:hypothetical protein
MSVTIVFTEAHLHRGENGPDTVELVGAGPDGQTLALSAVLPRGLGDDYIKELGFAEYISNEPAEYLTRSGHAHTAIAKHTVKQDGTKWRKQRRSGKDYEVKVDDDKASEPSKV